MATREEQACERELAAFRKAPGVTIMDDLTPDQRAERKRFRIQPYITPETIAMHVWPPKRRRGQP